VVTDISGRLHVEVVDAVLESRAQDSLPGGRGQLGEVDIVSTGHRLLCSMLARSRVARRGRRDGVARWRRSLRVAGGEELEAIFKATGVNFGTVP